MFPSRNKNKNDSHRSPFYRSPKKWSGQSGRSFSPARDRVGFQEQIKSTALTRRAFHSDPSAMSHGDFFGNGQSKSGAGLGLAGNAKKPVENPGVVFFRNTGAVICDAEFNVIVLGQRGAQNNLATDG